jgi:hypothetical protein
MVRRCGTAVHRRGCEPTGHVPSAINYQRFVRPWQPCQGGVELSAPGALAPSRPGGGDGGQLPALRGLPPGGGQRSYRPATRRLLASLLSCTRALPGEGRGLAHVLFVKSPARACTGARDSFADEVLPHRSCTHIITVKGYTIGNKAHYIAIKALKIMDISMKIAFAQ